MTEKKTKTKEPSLVVAITPQESAESTTANLPAPPKKKMGRPTIYSQELVNTICTRLSLGESLRSICRDDDMPAQSLIYLWLNRHPDFLEQYTRAREEQAETHADEIVEIADEQPDLIEVKDKDGNVVDIKLD